MLRRSVRLRREYLYQKSLEGKERLLYEKIRKIKQALQEGKPIPIELRNDEATLRQEIDLEDERTQRIEVMSEIVETCRSHDFTDLILVYEHRGVPAKIVISHLPFGPTAYFQILNVVTRHDCKDKKEMGTVSEAYPHLILNFSTNIGRRTANILKHLFPVPKTDTKHIITFANQSDYISFRHHVYRQSGRPKSIDLKEVEPRFELRLYQIKLGTVDQEEDQTEWVLRSFVNTSKKQKVLGE